MERFEPGYNSRLVGVVADGSKNVGAGVDAARIAFDNNVGGWVTDHKFRAQVKAAELVRQEGERLAVIESLFSGKTIRISRLGDVPRAAELLEFYAGISDKLHVISHVLKSETS